MGNDAFSPAKNDGRALLILGMPLPPTHVFVIDQDLTWRQILSELLRAIGLEVHPYATAEEFLSDYSGARPTCVVTEFRMPGMTAAELLSTLRNRGLSMPVVVVTAHADTPTTVKAMQAGAFTTIDKPWRESDLLDAIRNALREDERLTKEDQQRAEEEQRRQAIRDRIARLTRLEYEVLRGLLAGEANKAMAQRLDIGLRTVETKRKSMLKKMGVDSIAALVKLVLLAQLEELSQQPPAL